MRSSSVQRAVLARAIDYAGLFPPATLSLAEAVRNYALYATSDESWALGRFVLPVSRIDDFEVALGQVEADDAGFPWSLAAVCGSDVRSDARRIERFNQANGAVARVDTVECRTAGIDEIKALALAFPSLNRFAEIATGELAGELFQAVAQTGSHAKIRTGGVILGAVPPSLAVLNFILGCKKAGVAFKATAGLHHLVRGSYRLTYESESPSGVMFGYLNVIGAAAAAFSARSEAEIRSILEAEDPGTLILDDRGLEWSGVSVSLDEIERTRSDFMLGFGSCSFREPMDEMVAMVERTMSSPGGK